MASKPTHSVNARQFREIVKRTKCLPYHAQCFLATPDVINLLKTHPTDGMDHVIRVYEAELKAKRADTRIRDELNAIFDEYQRLCVGGGDEPDVLYDDGFYSFIIDGLHQELDLLNPLLLSYLVQSKIPGEITREEFYTAFMTYGQTTLPAMAGFVQRAFRDIITTEVLFQDLYMWTFNLARRGSDQRSIPLKEARIFWKILLPYFPSFTTYPQFFVFLDLQNVVNITRDLWQNLYHFAMAMRDDYVTNFNIDEDDGWNSTLDQFALYMIAQHEGYFLQQQEEEEGDDHHLHEYEMGGHMGEHQYYEMEEQQYEMDGT